MNTWNLRVSQIFRNIVFQHQEKLQNTATSKSYTTPKCIDLN